MEGTVSVGIPLDSNAKLGDDYAARADRLIDQFVTAPDREARKTFTDALRAMCRQGAPLVELLEERYENSRESGCCGLSRQGSPEVRRQLERVEAARAKMNRTLMEVVEESSPNHRDSHVHPGLLVVGALG
mmetsp:Transcript_19068/g.22792  ORF Transcript_19068/g.22792 Transcript_19068/m.22792 type:complete len:131 (+) Transcript_19068:183-575(+)